MRIGQYFAIAGALLVLIGLGVLNPLFGGMFGGLIVPMYELEIAEKFVHGTQISILQPLIFFAVIAAALAVLAFFVRVKKRLAITNLIFAVAIIGTMAYVHGNAQSVLAAAIAPATMFSGETIVFLEGPLLVYLGGLSIFVGALVVFAARPVFRESDRFLRVAVLWNGSIIREDVFFEPKDVTVGEDPESDFVLPTGIVAGLPSRIPLFRKAGKQGYNLNVLPQMRGQVNSGEKSLSLEKLAAEHGASADTAASVPLHHDDWGVLNVGEQSLFFQFVPPEQQVARKSVAAMPWDLAASTMLSGTVQVSVILAALFLWQETAVRTQPRDIRKLMQVEVETRRDEPMEEELLDLDTEEIEYVEDDDAQFDDREVPPEDRGREAKRDDVAKVDPKRVGLNDLLSRSDAKGAISDILSADTSSFSNKLAVAMDGTGAEFVMGHSSGGLGFAGTGGGGGGAGGYGRIHGLGRIDTGGGAGVRAGTGKRRTRQVAKLSLGSGASQGFCSRGDISKNVRMRAGAIRACYEQQLQIRPNLAGQVSVRWTIQLDGTVRDANVTASTLNNQAVENCILRAIRRIRFAKPDGGICVVQWPFVFNPG